MFQQLYKLYSLNFFIREIYKDYDLTNILIVFSGTWLRTKKF